MVQPTKIYSALQSFDQQNEGTAGIFGMLSEVNGLDCQAISESHTPKTCGLKLELKLEDTFPRQNQTAYTP